MPTPFNILLGPANGVPFAGVDTLHDSYEVAVGAAASVGTSAEIQTGRAALNIDLTDGSLRGLYGPGTPAGTTIAAGAKFLFWVNSLSAWIADAGTTGVATFACQDGPVSTTGYQAVYKTTYSGTTATQPVMYDGASAINLGVAASGSAATAGTGTGGGVRAYYYTYVNKTNGKNIESNPSPIATTTACGGAVITTPTAQPDTTSQVTHKRIYATLTGSTTGTAYLLAEITLATGTYTDGAANAPSNSPTFPAGTAVMNFSVGGSVGNTVYPYDHSPAPALGVISDVPHAINPGGGAGTGIVFGSLGSTLYWSATGKPWYWPTVNTTNLPSYIEGIISEGATTWIFTRNEIYMATGTDDQTIQIARTRSAYGLNTACGHTLAKSPYGILFLAREGLGLWNGITASIITGGILDPRTLDNQSGIQQGAFANGLYHLQPYGMIIDLTSYPAVRVVRTSTGITALCMTVFPDATPTLYVAQSGITQPAKWMPRDRDTVSGAVPLANYSWISSKLTGGAGNAPKRFNRLWLNGAGTLSLLLTAGYENGSTQTQTLTGSGWLGMAMQGDYLTVAVSSSDGTGVVHGITIDCEVLDGA